MLKLWRYWPWKTVSSHLKWVQAFDATVRPISISLIHTWLRGKGKNNNNNRNNNKQKTSPLVTAILRYRNWSISGIVWVDKLCLYDWLMVALDTFDQEPIKSFDGPPSFGGLLLRPIITIQEITAPKAWGIIRWLCLLTLIFSFFLSISCGQVSKMNKIKYSWQVCSR